MIFKEKDQSVDYTYWNWKHK